MVKNQGLIIIIIQNSIYNKYINNPLFSMIVTMLKETIQKLEKPKTISVLNHFKQALIFHQTPELSSPCLYKSFYCFILQITGQAFIDCLPAITIG